MLKVSSATPRAASEIKPDAKPNTPPPTAPIAVPNKGAVNEPAVAAAPLIV